MSRPSEEGHEALAALANARGWPAPPERPVVGECCDRFCEPCVWDYYEQALRRWCDRHEVALGAP